jgi:predicted P-loop ATPase
MRDLKIAYGNSCFAKKWSNKAISWDALCERLKTTVRTTETVEEYPKLPKADRDRAKDIGGFVAAELSGGRRKRETVVCRSMLSLDGDKVSPDFLDSFELLNTHAAAVYSTHSHTPENPRLRIVVPLARDVTPDEYNAVARYYAADLGIDQFDECSYRPHQLMYWPSTPSNGEYVFKAYGGVWLDPDDILSAHPNWRDPTLLPTSSRESAVHESAKGKQQDPLAKHGVIGAFCRTYSIEAAIETFLPEAYEPSAIEGRYDYVPADSSAGVVVYEGKFAYSHHASDPAYGQLCNAFDLVRIHRFSDLDEKKSLKAMSELALADDNVRLLLIDEKAAQAGEDFKEADDNAWKRKLVYDPHKKELANSVWNLMLILENDPNCAGFGYNELANRVQVTGDVPWKRPPDNKFWRDADTAQLKAYIDNRYLSFTTRNHDVCFIKTADDRRFHPIRDYLDGLPAWDGVERIPTLLVHCLQADDTPYVRAVTRKTFAAAVARVYRPGTKFDSVLVFDGAQGIGKSTLLKDLVGDEFYSETLSLTDMDDKSGAEKLQGFWVVEIGELAGMKKADIEKVKAFLSTADDKYRPSYGKTVESHPRQCVIIASVNGERGYLRDITGNRRFWIVKVHQEEQVKRWHFSDDDRNQIWAEAKHLWQSGEKLYLEGEMITAAEEAQRSAMEVDERTGPVEVYLDTLLPENWDKMDTFARRSYLNDSDDPTQPKGAVRREYVSNAEIWAECLGRNIAELKPVDSYSLSALMSTIPGWERTRERCRIPLYGQQRMYRRIPVTPREPLR